MRKTTAVVFALSLSATSPAFSARSQEAPATDPPLTSPVATPVGSTAVQQAGATRPVHTRVPRNATIFIEGAETVDASNSKDKASYGDFSVAVTAALAKKKVPVLVVADPDRADFLIRHTSAAREDSTGTKVAKIIIMGGLWGTKDFNASIMVIDKNSTAVLFSYNVKKGNFQSAAESFAKHLNNHIQGKD